MITENQINSVLDSPQVPTLPAIALQVLELASHPDCEMDEIAALIRLDPALSSQILRTVNSALFGIPRKVSSVDQAIGLIGLKQVRSLVISFSLPSLQQGEPNQQTREFWCSSVTGSIVARMLAERMNIRDVEDEFTAGLLRDIGILVLAQVYPEGTLHLDTLDPLDLADRRCEMENAVFGLDHATVSEKLLERWKLPDEISRVVGRHHQPLAVEQLSPNLQARTKRLYFATLAAQLLVTPDQPRIREKLIDYAAEHFDMNESQLFAFLEPLDGKIAEFIELLHVDAGSNVQFANIVSRATQQLMQLTIEASADTARARLEVDAARKEATRWQRTAYRLKQKGELDPLTGVHNRGSFEESLVREFKRSGRRCTVLGLIFLDLDGFKILNDKFGHAFGDQVLKDVARTIRRRSRQGDHCARYGGDEFCVITNDGGVPDGLRAQAERLWHAISGLTIQKGNDVGQVGASIGAVACLPLRGHLSYEDFLHAADQAMYSAKHGGKNRVTYVSLLSAEEEELIEAVQKRLFSRYLEGRAIATPEALREGVSQLRSEPNSFRRLLRSLGWLNQEQIAAVLREQRRTKRPFPEIANQRGMMSVDRMASLYAIQQQRPRDLARVLVENGAIEEQHARELLKSFAQQIQKSQ